MEYPLKPIDANGDALTEGDKVLFKQAPETLLHGLLQEDQNAIKAQEGRPLEIIGFDKYGHAEMEFTAADGGMHTIWVEPHNLFKVKK
jgi:hypothetical protein